MITHCPCCSGKMFRHCCAPFLSGTAKPKTVKQLMRSRYCAFALGGHGEYLLRTWHPDTAPPVSADELSAADTEWTGLEIVHSSQRGDSGSVEFRAHFIDEQGAARIHHEHSQFTRSRGQWQSVTAISHKMHDAPHAEPDFL